MTRGSAPRGPREQYELRAAAPADIPAMITLQHATWTEAFLALLPADFEVKPVEAWGDGLRRAMETDGVEALVARASGGIVGFVVFGANRDADAEPDTGEVRALFVHPDQWRTGVGTALVRRAVRELVVMGYTRATLWSFRDNDRANAFYERRGLERDGATQARGSLGAPEVRYHRRLDQRYTF